MCSLILASHIHVIYVHVILNNSASLHEKDYETRANVFDG